MARTVQRQHWLAKAIGIIGLCLGLFGAAHAQTIALNWAQWEDPRYFPDSTSPHPGIGATYKFTPQVKGTLALPDGSVVDVTLDGEVLDESCFATRLADCFQRDPLPAPTPPLPPLQWWIYTAGGWPGFPASTFISSNVPSLPNNANMVAMSGLAVGYEKHTLTFSKPVSNIVMNIVSLGAAGKDSTYSFTQDFNILSQDPREAQFRKDGKDLTGNESSGTIQFVGTYTSIEWTVSVWEYFSGFNFGTTSASTSSLSLQHQWAPGAVTGDAMQASTSGGLSPASVAATAQRDGNTDTGATVALLPGNVVSFPAPGYTASPGASYSATLACTNAGLPRALTGSAFPYTLTVDAADTDLVCTYTTTNATPVVQLSLSSQWASSAIAGDTLTASTSGGSASASVASAAQTGGNTVTGSTAQLTQGDVITLPLPTYTLANGQPYTTTLSCTNNGSARPVEGTTFPYTLTVQASDLNLACSYTSARVPPVVVTLALASQWGADAQAGDQLTAASVGGSNAAQLTSTALAGGNTDAGTPVALQLGDVLSFPAPSYTSAAPYATSLSCTNAGAARALDGSAFPYGLTVTASDSTLVCLYVSSRPSSVASARAVPATGWHGLLLLSLAVGAAGLVARQRRAVAR